MAEVVEVGSKVWSERKMLVGDGGRGVELNWIPEESKLDLSKITRRNV